MPTVIENNGQVIWGRTARCPECGNEWESFNHGTPEGGIEICDECVDRDHYNFERQYQDAEEYARGAYDRSRSNR